MIALLWNMFFSCYIGEIIMNYCYKKVFSSILFFNLNIRLNAAC